MTIRIALLRAVNLAGRNKVDMAKLRELLADLGLKEPRSLLQSGNLVFRSDERSGKRLEDLLQDAARTRRGKAFF